MPKSSWNYKQRSVCANDHCNPRGHAVCLLQIEAGYCGKHLAFLTNMEGVELANGVKMLLRSSEKPLSNMHLLHDEHPHIHVSKLNVSQHSALL